VRSSIYRILMGSLVAALAIAFQSPLAAATRNHVVSPAELQQATASAARTRQQNIARVEKFLSSRQAEKALKSAHLDPVQVKKAVPSLSNQELARLASRADKTQKDFAAGGLTHGQVTLIILATALVAVILAVK
jgi:hypothetical protein